MLRHFAIAAVLSLLACPISAQNEPATAINSAKPADYSQEGMVVEQYITRVSFESDGSGVREVTAVARAQSEAGVQQMAVLTFPYTSGSETLDVDYVRVRKADGSVVVTPAYNIQDMPADVTRIAPMYSDIHEKHITVKALGVGDTLEYLIRFHIKPEIPGQFWFSHNFIKDGICKNEQLEISFPKDKYVNLSSTDLKPALREEANRKIYTWRSSNFDHKETNKKELPKREAPRPDLELTTFHSWEEVGAWYADLQKDQIVVTPELQKKAEELTKGLNTEDEKIHALYNFVAIRFHYVSLSFGIGRYQPHAADEVLGNEYGDCKDKHTLLATMLKAVGIDAWPALINSARKIDNDLPSPSSFDHMITVIPRGNQMIWLDTTSEVAPFGLLLTGLRGKQALIIPRGKPAQLVKTPEEAVLPFANNFSVDGKLGADGVFTGHVDRSFRGDIEVLMRASYRRLPQSNWKDLTQQLSYATGFSGDVSEVQVSTPEDTAKPFTLSYDYTRKKYGDWDNHRITPPMPPFGIEVPDTDERRPVEPFLLGATGEVVYHARVELPAFSRAVAPSDMDLKEDFAEYQATYSIKDGVLTADRRLIVKKSEVSVADWDRYAKFRKAVSDDENKWINLDVRTVSTVAKNSSWPKFYTDDADHKFQQATQALQNHDIIKSTDLMREVLQLDPKYQGANAIMGWLDFVQNRREDGLAKLQKEEYLHPDYVPSYAMGAWMYTVLKRPDDASDQWRKLLKVQPENRDAVMKLSRLLIDSKKYTDAINILEETSATAPDNKVIKSLLATAYLRSGQREEGVNIIQKNFADETNPSLLNDVAYELALANTNLELAEKFSQSSVKFFDSLTVTKEVNNNTAGDMAAIFYTLQVTSAWDTLGWIYFRMGQLDKAVSYLRPAWMITQSSTQGDHLAQVYQQQGKIKEAEHTYQLAYAAASSLNGNAEEIREHYRALTGKPLVNSVSTHRLPDGSWSLTAAEELGRIRTFKVPVKSSANGSATFGVAFVNGKVEQVVFVDGSTELKSLSDDVRNANFDVLSPQDNFPVRVVRRGILMCRSTGCEFTFMLPPNESPNELPTAF